MLRRFLKAFLAGFVVLVAGIALWLHSSLPQTTGELDLHGLSGKVRIERDRYGIPRIVAANDADAAFALGFLHAQDRLFQMEMQRRFGAGRLAEVVGPALEPTDRLMRTLGLYHLAEQQYGRLSSDLRQVLDAYAAGVNAFLDERRGALPLEYYLLGFRPEKWRPADTLVYAKLMALQLTANYRGELMRARLATRLTPQQVETLYPEYPKDGVVALAALAPLYRTLPLDRLYAALPEGISPGGASNNWVVAGAHTASGKPVLADDPHLGFGAPGNWYLARVETPGHWKQGVTAPGVPFFIIGQNERIAWGFTTTNGDVEDLYVERPVAGDPASYETPDGPKKFETREERLVIKGKPSLTMVVRSTRHGPVISDTLGGATTDGGVLALQATYLRTDDMTPQAVWDMNRARNWDEFNEALRNFGAPQQNIVYADIDGNIGFVAPARVPIRAKGDGWMPVPGWTNDYEWTGFIHYESLPRTLNPPTGHVVTANNKIVPDSYPFFISRDWDIPNRAQRITELLAEMPPMTMDGSAEIQADTLSLMAQHLLPLMLRVDPKSERARAAVERLAGWDGHMDRDKVEPLLFTAWLRALNRAILADELGDLFQSYWDLRPLVMRDILTRDQSWCDDRTTPEVETCEDALAASLETALGELATAYGERMDDWSWGRAHPAVFTNQVLTQVPILRDFASPEIPSSGGYDTVNRGATSIRSARPYANVHGSGLRMIVDLAAPGEARWMIVPGQSGNILSPHYADLVRPWRDFASLTLPGAPVATLVLAPQ